MNKKFSALGHEINIAPKEGKREEKDGLPIGREEIAKATTLLTKYKDGKASLERRIIENERWYKLRHWEVVNNNDPNKIEPSSAWLFNSLYNKHADAMDNYPEPNVLPRERGDVDEAEKLSKIIPLVMEHNDFEQVYNDAWWYKLKNGAAAYGIFWNTDLENGLGDIDIKKLDLLNIFWEPGISNIQDSKNLFIVELVDNDVLLGMYPDIEARKLRDIKVINVGEYIHDDKIDTEDKSLVIDWYYKTKIGSKTVLHYVKFVGETILYASENDELYADRGYYDHGEYPIHLDVLFPVEGSPVGFGYIDVMRDPQLYIDKLGSIIMRNAYMAGKKRHFIREDAGINEEEYADWEKDFVHVAGSIDERSVMEIEVKPLPAFIMQHRQNVIDELKETSGNRDFSQGGSSGGVTAAAAIAALQEAGNKLSRDMIKGAYRTYSSIIYTAVELMRQFYDTEREFRITGEDGKIDFTEFSNAGIVPQELPPAAPDMEPAYRKPIFDIKIKAQKSNPFSRMAQNELAKELYGAGFFNPQMADQALIALDLMDFEGKQGVIEKINKNQMLMMQVQQMQQRMLMMAQVIEQHTGQPMTQMLMQEMAGQGEQPIPQAGAMQDNRNAQSKSYGERIAERATPTVE